jgi:hypothetical protein
LTRTTASSASGPSSSSSSHTASTRIAGTTSVACSRWGIRHAHTKGRMYKPKSE